jgi:Flp pilus assembly pilin Flp
MRNSRISVAGLMLALVAPALIGAATQKVAPAVGGALRFIQDDSTAALAEAKRRGVPIFVEAWAPW